MSDTDNSQTERRKISLEEDLKFRRPNGTFMPGHPSTGSPKGALSRKTILARKIAGSLGEERYRAAYSKLADLAERGDVAAIKLLMEHGWGKPRHTPEPMDTSLDLPPLTDSKSLVVAADIVIQAMVSGSLEPEHGKGLLEAIETARKALDTHTILERLDALERDRDQMDRLN